jgi:hypothetical protein
LADIATVFVNILELSQRLDNVDALASPRNNELRAFVQTVVEDLESLQDVSPVLALVVETLVDHIHDIVEFGGTI